MLEGGSSRQRAAHDANDVILVDQESRSNEDHHPMIPDTRHDNASLPIAKIYSSLI